MKKVVMGNHAAAYGAKLARAEVVAAYPITPQTQTVEKISEMVASGEMKAEFIKVESEHSAMAACIGASRRYGIHQDTEGNLPGYLRDRNRRLSYHW